MKRDDWPWIVSVLSVILMVGIAACGSTLPYSRAGGPNPIASPPKSEPPASNPPPPTSKGSLWTGGTKLRGANIYQRRVYAELDGLEFMGPGPVGPPYTQADFDALAAMGANYVNISHPGLFAEEPPYALDAGIQASLDNLLAMAAQADLFAVITFRTGPGRSEFWAFWGEDTVSDPQNGWFDPSYYNNRVWGDQAAQDAWVAMWRYTAERYRDNPVVASYDLMCEPNSNEVGSHPLDDPLDIWEPDEFYAKYGGTLYDWNQLYPRITAAIRQVDAETPILIGGNGYSGVEWLPYLEPTGDPRTVYTVHQYAPHLYTHQQQDATKCTYPGFCDLDWDGEYDDPLDRAWLEGMLSTVDDFVATYSVPVAVNEFGAVRWTRGVAEFIDDEMELFEGRGMNHALWVWDPAWRPWNEEVNAFNFRFGPDPDNDSDVPSSALLSVIQDYWGRNAVRPSEPVTATSFLPIVLTASSPESGPLPLADVKYWAYQIQDVAAPGAVDALVASRYDLWCWSRRAPTGRRRTRTLTPRPWSPACRPARPATGSIASWCWPTSTSARPRTGAGTGPGRRSGTAGGRRRTIGPTMSWPVTPMAGRATTPWPTGTRIGRTLSSMGETRAQSRAEIT